MDYRSYTQEEVRAAQKAGKRIFILDTGNDGQDDVLIGEEGDTSESLLLEARIFYEKTEEEISGWTCEEVDFKI